MTREDVMKEGKYGEEGRQRRVGSLRVVPLYH